MQLRKNIIDQIEQYLKSEYLSISNVCYFMQSIRILLEIDNSQTKYKIANLYCNWLLHKELDKSSLPPIIIQSIADSFKNFDSKNDLIKKVNESISLKKLIVELKEILWVNMNNKVVVSKMDYEEYWIQFIRLLLSQLLFRPIKLKQNQIILDGFQFSIYGLQIVPLKNNYNIELLSEELEEKKKRFIIDIALFRE